jgi:nucleoside-diphosphate-sugar epimerase
MMEDRGNMKRYLESDLYEISRHTTSFLAEFSGKNVLIGGATGFVGSWLIAFLDYANRTLATNFSVTGIARTIPTQYKILYPQVNFLEGDVSNYRFPSEFRPDCVINAATPSVPKSGGEDPEQILKASIEGTQNLIELCSPQSATLYVNLSSGIVTKRSADESLDLSKPKDAYLFGKRMSENLIMTASMAGAIKGKNPRLYAFAGPGISLTDHFAVGNFLNDALSARPIVIKGNPDTLRSYLYPTDLIINLLNLVINTSEDPMEIGSSSSITMQELALVVNKVTGNRGITQLTEFGPKDAYLPNSSISTLHKQVDIEEAIARWIKWLES